MRYSRSLVAGLAILTVGLCHAETTQSDSIALPNDSVDTSALPVSQFGPEELWISSDFSYGLFVGTGPRWTCGRLNEYFSWAWDFTLGGKIAWERLYLEASVSFASPTLKKSNLLANSAPDNKFRANVKNANYTAYGFNVGYAIYDTGNFSIIPFVGGKWTGYSWTARPLEYSPEVGDMVMTSPQHKMKVGDFNVDFGVNFDWHFNSTVITAGGKAQRLTSSLRITPYAVRGVYSDAVPSFDGWQVGVMIAYSATARKLKPLRF